MNARKFLERIGKIDRLIENKIAEKRQLLSIATGTTVQLKEKVQTSGSKQKMADAIDSYVDLENDDIKKLVREKEEIISVIEGLKEIHYDVLHKLYVQKFTLYDVAEAHDKSYSWATSIHGRALQSLDKLLEERVK